jgi:hypothetical protein
MESIHLTVMAADIIPVINGKIPWVVTGKNAGLWLEFGKLGQEAGLEWGGTWKPFDKFGIGWDAPKIKMISKPFTPKRSNLNGF